MRGANKCGFESQLSIVYAETKLTVSSAFPLSPPVLRSACAYYFGRNFKFQGIFSAYFIHWNMKNLKN
jgi:hypothetical protein